MTWLAVVVVVLLFADVTGREFSSEAEYKAWVEEEGGRRQADKAQKKAAAAAERERVLQKHQQRAASQVTSGSTAGGAHGLTRESLETFYRQHNPARLSSVNAILGSSGEMQLLRKLHDTYGAVPQLHPALAEKWGKANLAGGAHGGARAKASAASQHAAAARAARVPDDDLGLQQALRENPALAERFRRERAEREWAEEEGVRLRAGKQREAAKRGEQDARNRERLAHIRAVRAAAEAEELHRQQGVLRAQHEQQYRDRDL
jgi:hypothetical protein